MTRAAEEKIKAITETVKEKAMAAEAVIAEAEVAETMTQDPEPVAKPAEKVVIPVARAAEIMAELAL